MWVSPFVFLSILCVRFGLPCLWRKCNVRNRNHAAHDHKSHNHLNYAAHRVEPTGGCLEQAHSSQQTVEQVAQSVENYYQTRGSGDKIETVSRLHYGRRVVAERSGSPTPGR